MNVTMTKQSNMLYKCVNNVDSGDIAKAYMKVLSYVAITIKVPGVCTETMTLDQKAYLEENCDVSALNINLVDHFTPVLEKLRLIPVPDKPIIRNLYSQLHDFYNQTSSLPKPIITKILPQYTNQLMFEAFKLFNLNSIYTIVEPELLIYRTLLVNAKLFEIPALVLNLNPIVFNSDIHSNNWDYANLWDGYNLIQPN